MNIKISFIFSQGVVIVTISRFALLSEFYDKWFLTLSLGQLCNPFYDSIFAPRYFYLTRLNTLFIPMLPVKADSTAMLRMLSNANAESCYC